jgi:hypothetical protein
LALGILALQSLKSETALDRFWKPVTDQPGSIILCVGPDRRIFGGAAALPAASTTQTAAPPTAPASPAAPLDRARQVVVGDDAITLARVAAELARRNKDFRIFLGSSATFEDIRERPSVLIGTRNNEAALEIINSTRFRLMTPGGGVESYILDTEKSSGGKRWVPTPGALKGEYVRDYALIVRCLHPKAGKIVVVCGGVHAPGNFAAGDFLTNEKLISQLDSLAKPGWERKNVAVVLATEVVKGVAGVPTIEATHFW